MIKRLLRKHGDGEAAADDDDDDDDEPVEPKLTAKQRRMQKRSGHEPPKNVEEDDEDDEEEDEEPSTSNPEYPSVTRKTTHKKKKVLVICSRGVTSSNVELMEDVIKLLPHARKDPKFDKKEALTSIVEIAQLAGCHLALYFEARKMRDLYLWAGRIDGGPSVKFLVEQVRPMRDLRLTGNCLLGSRPILSFDGGFNATPHLQLLQQLLAAIFSPPKGHPRSKPFHDHVLSFSLLEGRVLVRHYQSVPSPQGPKLSGEPGGNETLVEIGPRFALVPIRLLSECFSGETIFANEAFISPNMARSEQKKRRARSTVGGVVQKEKRRKRFDDGYAELPEDELGDVFTA